MQQTNRQKTRTAQTSSQQGNCAWHGRFIAVISVALATVAVISVGFVGR